MDEEVPIQTEVNQLAAGAKRNSWTESGGGVPGGGGNLILKQLLSLASVGQQFCTALHVIYRVRENRDPVLTGPCTIYLFSLFI